MKKIIVITLSIFLLLFSHLIPIQSQGQSFEVKSIKHQLSISPPIFIEDQSHTMIKINESDGYLSHPGQPLLPVITKKFIFPFGTKIVDIRIESDSATYQVPGIIRQSSGFNDEKVDLKKSNFLFDNMLFETDTSYPKNNYFIKEGCGIFNGEHVLFYIINIFPRYDFMKNVLINPESVDISIDYILSENIIFGSMDSFDMCIITSEQFSDSFHDFIDHKNEHGISTFVMTTQKIYSEYPGRDHQEKIKYFIKDAIEKHDIRYVLLAGDVHIVPMRKTQVTTITPPILWRGILTDSYYADIFNFNLSFSSWDTNKNDEFGECLLDFRNGETSLIDRIDLFPDVGIGRIPCSSNEELQVILDKIISYELCTYDSEWFNNIILMAGDTNPMDNYGIQEGEWFLKNKISSSMKTKGFVPKDFFVSQNTFIPKTISQNINSGAGFVVFSGHGNTNQIMTFLTNDTETVQYTMEDFEDLKNGNKLPIFFIDACLTGKLDNNILDKISPNNLFLCYVKSMLDNTIDHKILPFFAWDFLKKENGGGIASIAASQPAIEGLWNDGNNITLYFGSSLFCEYFFNAYHKGCLISDMMIETQNNYISNISDYYGTMWDRNTFDEFNLIGDPSLKIGGYP
jgi:hypothetical protein